MANKRKPAVPEKLPNQLFDGLDALPDDYLVTCAVQ